MTAVTATPPALEQYLRRATAGLPPAKRQEVWDELEEHVYCRAEQLEWQGAAPEQALAQALAELGPPLRVSAGMNGVHNMPKILSIGGIAALLVTAGLYALAGGGNLRAVTVEVPALSQKPLETEKFCVQETKVLGRDFVVLSRQDGKICYAPQRKALYQGAFIGLNDIQKAYESAGLKTSFKPDGTLHVTFPDGRWRVLMPRFKAGGQGYVPAQMLIISTIREPLTPELKLSGYDNPLLSFGPLKLRLGTQSQPVAGMDFYHQIMPTLLGALTSPDLSQGWSASYAGVNWRFSDVNTWPQVTVKTGLPAGEVVMLLTKKDAETYFADLAPVGADGKATLHHWPEHQKLGFVKDVRSLSASPNGGKIPAMLVKVTGVDLRHLKSGIFLPKP
ncbi:MAG: permease prefix domain 1-containing protein [Deinococcus sp.]|uniref:permease prefix domain 1-containing protein n=1 Tax=Deinococcus sp. TaxID=47478 RepID=UPI0026DB2774|nr:permease prefix domain 1-containing protein [Deinococcus sp.]MDO4245272.1 permease prefix domain 1-containing protein [Deinococcus sp.]